MTAIGSPPQPARREDVREVLVELFGEPQRGRSGVFKVVDEGADRVVSELAALQRGPDTVDVAAAVRNVHRALIGHGRVRSCEVELV